MADGNPDDNRQDSAAGDIPGAAADGGDKPDNFDDKTTASSSNSLVAEGLSSLISSVMTDFDSQAEATARSQDQLAFALDRLTGELDKLLEDAPSPFIMQHAARISAVRKRVKALNTVLKSIQRRIDNMDQMLSAGLAHGAETLGGRKQWATTCSVIEMHIRIGLMTFRRQTPLSNFKDVLVMGCIILKVFS